MLYSGHFSFDETGKGSGGRHGYFTCIVYAGTPALALQKFQTRIKYVKEEKKEALFENINAVYVEDIVEISDQPEEAVITRFQSSEGQFPKSRSCSLPASDTSVIKAYQWVPESDDIPVQSDEEYKTAVPFLKFN